MLSVTSLITLSCGALKCLRKVNVACVTGCSGSRDGRNCITVEITITASQRNTQHSITLVYKKDFTIYKMPKDHVFDEVCPVTKYLHFDQLRSINTYILKSPTNAYLPDNWYCQLIRPTKPQCVHKIRQNNFREWSIVSEVVFHSFPERGKLHNNDWLPRLYINIVLLSRLADD